MTPDVRVGDVYEDLERIERNMVRRQLTVVEIGETHATCHDGKGKRVKIRLDRIRPTKYGFKLISRVGQ